MGFRRMRRLARKTPEHLRSPPLSLDNPCLKGPLKYGSSKRQAWDNVSWKYDLQRRDDVIYHACADFVTELTSSENAEGTVLDAGCGTGWTTIPLAGPFQTVLAVDFSFKSLKILQGKVGKRNIFPVAADLACLPFADSCFHAVQCANVLQHLAPPHHDVAVSELQRIARRGARICISVHHYSRLKRNAGWPKEEEPVQSGIDYIYRFSRADLARLAKWQNIRGIGFGLPRIPIIRLILEKFIAKRFGTIAARIGSGHMLVAWMKK